MIDKSIIDTNALQYYRVLKEAGFSAYFVGGSVRDLLLGKQPKDFDIATNATPHQIKRIIPQGRIIGRRFRHVMLEKNGGRYEIVTFRGPVLAAEEEAAEIDDAVAEEHTPLAMEDGQPEGQAQAGGQPSNNGNGEKRKNYPDLNQFGTAEQDAKRRDFTINALFYDPDADELVDYVEGKLDVDRKIVRAIGDPAVRMEEDPIRILRAIRHKMKLGLEYDPALETAMREKAPCLETTSKDRIREEFLKVCVDQSLCTFLVEARRMGLTKHLMPWFEEISEEAWEKSVKLWEKFQEAELAERLYPDMGLALMMTPLIEPLVLTPYRSTLAEGEKNYLPDMKYFLSCEPLRNYYLRNLRISRAQTDHVVRALFYYSRMTGLWIEQGPPRRVVGRLFQHPPALLAAKMAKIFLSLEGKETPPWLEDLAVHDQGKRQHHHSDERDARRDRNNDRRGGRDRNHRRDRDANVEGHGDDSQNFHEGGTDDDASLEAGDQDSRGNRQGSQDASEDSQRSSPKTNRLPTLDKPMEWNGPLHAPVLRPIFAEEIPNRWARKNQTVRAFRPSGIPNQPTDYALLKSALVQNYKPELQESARGEEGERNHRGNDRGDRGGRNRGRDRNRDRKRGNDRHERGNSRPVNHEPVMASDQEGQPIDEDSIGNMRLPGEQPAALNHLPPTGPMDLDHDDDIDDNIGNRLDAPPTSGHPGVNGDGAILTHQQAAHGPRHGGGGGGRNRNNRGGRNRNNRGGRNRGRGGGGNRGPGGGGGPGRSFPPRDNNS